MQLRTPVAVALFCIGQLAASRYANAQQALGPERRDVRNLGGDIWSVWTSPARLRPADALPIAGAATVITLTVLQDSILWAWMSQHPDALVMRLLGPIREGWKFPAYELGSGQFILPLSGAIYAAGRLRRNAALRDAGMGCAAGHLASLGVRSIVLGLVARARPRVTPQPFQLGFPGSKDWSHQSFLSGHASNSMACASFLGHRFSLGALEPLPYMYSTAIALGRMADGRHWASDTVTGSILGFAIGKAIADRQRARRTDDPSSAPTYTLRWSINF